MTLYRYSSDSLIDEVRIIANAAGGYRALLHARADATPAQLEAVQRSLHVQGYKTVPLLQDEKPQLEVRGFGDPEMFRRYLADQGWSQGVPAIIDIAGDHISKQERRSNKTLKIAGYAYNFGDAAYMTYSILDYLHDKQLLNEALKAGASAEKVASAKEAVVGGKLGIAGGIGYALGGIALSTLGSRDQSQNEIKEGVRKVNNFMARQDMEVPEDSSAHAITRKEKLPLTQRMLNFGRKNPSEVLNTIYTGVGILLAAASLKKVKALYVKDAGFFAKANEHMRNEVQDIGLGAVTMTSSLIGLLVKEKKREPDEPRHTGIRGLWQWIQEKPLRATGVGFGIATGVHAIATVNKYRAGDRSARHNIVFRGAFVLANIVAEAMIFLSSKGHGQGVKTDDSVEKSIVAAAAELISKQPVAEQQRLIEQLAGYMASPDALGGKAETIAADIRAQLHGLSSNPWARNTASEKPPQAVEKAAPPIPAPKNTVEAQSIAASERTTLSPPPAQAISA